MENTFTFIFIYHPSTNIFNFDLLNTHLSSLSKQTSFSITCHFINVTTLPSSLSSIPHIDMVCSLPSEASYLSSVLSHYPSLTWVHSLFAGVDKYLSLPEIKNNSSITLTNARGAYSVPLAEYTIMSLLYFNYHIPTYVNAFTSKQWKRPVNELVNNKTILIIGYGKNGIAIAKRVKPAFNMKVIGVVRVMRDNIEGKEYCDELYGFNDMNKEVISKADFVLATLPQTQQSVNLFNEDFFKKMKSSAVFINIGRGSAVVENDLVNALNENTIRGAVLDVTQNEPLEKESKLYDVSAEKLLITNHSGDVTSQYVEQCYAVLLDNIKSYITNNKKLVTIVNKEQGY